jgi:hypothetical protein
VYVEILNIDYNKLEAPDDTENWCFIFSRTKANLHDFRLPPPLGTTYGAPSVRVKV